MEAMGTDASRIDKVFLAGGFGYFLDVEKANKKWDAEHQKEAQA